MLFLNNGVDLGGGCSLLEVGTEIERCLFCGVGGQGVMGEAERVSCFKISKKKSKIRRPLEVFHVHFKPKFRIYHMFSRCH